MQMLMIVKKADGLLYTHAAMFSFEVVFFYPTLFDVDSV